MRPLSAIECISPAIERTKLILFTPFHKGRSWKLSATAYLSSMGWLFIPLPLAALLLPWLAPQDGTSRTRFALVFMGGLVIVTAFMSVLFYIGSRLEFALFDVVLLKAQFIAPLWRKYAAHTWRWAGLKIAYGTVISTIIGFPLAIWLARSLWKLPTQQGQPTPALTAGFFLMWGISMCWICIFFLGSSLLGNFILPSIALEDATLRESTRRFVELVRAEPSQFIYFALLKGVLAIAALIIEEVGILLTELIAFIPLGLIGFLGWLLLHPLGEIGKVLMVAGVVVLWLIGVAFVFYCLIGIQGCVLTFFQAYALYFLGGRYPILGDLLDRSTPPPTNAYPADLAPYPPPYYPPPSGPPPSLPGA